MIIHQHFFDRMTSVKSITYFVVCVGSGTVFSLSKQDFSKARTALKNLENFVKSQASSMNSKIHALGMDMTAMEKDFESELLSVLYSLKKER